MPFAPGKIDTTVFSSPLSDEARYWIGLLLADGCLYVRKGFYGKEYPIILLGLHSREHNHVVRFRDFLCTEAKVSNRMLITNYGYSEITQVSVWLQGMENDLKHYGIIPNKTKHPQHVHDSLAGCRHFWRGLVDGDGTVMLVRNRGIPYPAVQFGGSQVVAAQFVQFVKQTIDFTPKIRPCRSIFTVGFNGGPAKDFIRELYRDTDLIIPSKLEKVKACLAWQARRSRRRLIS